jgi:hypothetical protein
MSDESSANERFLTVDEMELRRILEVKDSKNTRRATHSAVRSLARLLISVAILVKLDCS